MKKFWRALIPGITRFAGLHFPLVFLKLHDVIAAQSIRKWVRRLGLDAYRVVCRPTHTMQVTGPDGRAGHQVVGVIIDGQLATIVHTRRLREEDIVHELLHVARPKWPHEQVELWTGLLLAEAALSVLVREGERLDWRIAIASEAQFALPKPASTVVPEYRQEFGGMNEVTAYNLKTKKHTRMLQPELVTLKNGRKALRGIAADDGKTTVVRMMSVAAIADWEKP